MLAEWARLDTRLKALDHALWLRASSLPHGCGTYRNVWHNAMIDYNAGRPWRDVDYSALRHAIRIDEVLRPRVRAIGSRLWDRLYRRYYPEYQG
jgi:hypothetical protein